MQGTFVEENALRRFIERVLLVHGADESELPAVVDALLWCDRRGLSSQGLYRLPTLAKRVRAGGIVSPCRAEFRRISDSAQILEGRGGFGQFLGTLAVRRAAELAATEGVSIVTVRDSNHAGSPGYFANLGAERGVIVLVTSNAFPSIAPVGGKQPVIGTNPIAFAAPRRNGESLIIDMGATASSRVSLLRRAEREGAVPEGIAVDKDGRPVTDPDELADATLLPPDGARSVALGLIVEVLSGVLTGSGYSREVHSFYRQLDRKGNLGLVFLCLQVDRFLPVEEFDRRLEDLARILKTSGEEARLPGEGRWRVQRRNEARGGIDLDPQTVQALEELASEEGVPVPWR